LGVIVLATLLGLWGATVVVAPICFAIGHLLDGEIIPAVGTIIVMGVMGTIWFVAAHGAYEWCRKKLKNGTFFRPWNETNS
tara:strand:- start:230 stop:472 length:243 start_codon:yes stop_codon:yes gene_type:complete